MLDAIAQKARAAGQVAIISHISPDGDTLGSALALSLALDSLGVKNDVYCQDPVPESYQFLPGWERVKTPPADPPAYSLVISVDGSDRLRLGNCIDLFDAAADDIVVDHHHTNPAFGRMNLIRPCAATGVIMLDIVHALGVPLTREIAENLYVAIVTDTGNFNYANVNGEALRAAAELVDAGIDVPGITERLYRLRSPQKTMLLGRAVSGMELRLDGRVSIQALTLADYEAAGASDSDTEGLINYGIECEGVQIAILARETGDGVKFSLRSRCEVDAGSLAAQFEGGGHDAAAGLTLHEEIGPAVERVYVAVKQALEK